MQFTKKKRFASVRSGCTILALAPTNYWFTANVLWEFPSCFTEQWLIVIFVAHFV